MSKQLRSLYIDPEKCDGRMSCLRACPTEAIRVREGKARILQDRCIDCGECINSCPNGAILPLTDSFTGFSEFRHVVAVPSPVLYGQFTSEVLPGGILYGLKKIGFDDVADVAHACESVSLAIGEFVSAYHGPKPLISAFCPTIVRLIQVRFTDLAELLLPLESPMEIAAREMKLRKSEELGLAVEDIGAIYVTPCPAKMVAIRRHPRKKTSYLDGAISIADVYGPLLSAMADLEENQEVEEPKEMSGRGLGWPILGRVTKSVDSENCLAVSGLGDVVRIFEEIENGKLRDMEIIECLACPTGCIGGSLTVENPYVARGKIMRLARTYGDKPRQEMSRIKQLYQESYFQLDGKLMLRPVRPLDEDVSRAIELIKEKQEIFENLPKIDCGACGAPSCMTFAEDVVRGEVNITGCVFKRLEEQERSAGGFPEGKNQEQRRPGES